MAPTGRGQANRKTTGAAESELEDGHSVVHDENAIASALQECVDLEPTSQAHDILEHPTRIRRDELNFPCSGCLREYADIQCVKCGRHFCLRTAKFPSGCVDPPGDRFQCPSCTGHYPDNYHGQRFPKKSEQPEITLPVLIIALTLGTDPKDCEENRSEMHSEIEEKIKHIIRVDHDKERIYVYSHQMSSADDNVAMARVDVRKIGDWVAKQRHNMVRVALLVETHAAKNCGWALVGKLEKHGDEDRYELWDTVIKGFTSAILKHIAPASPKIAFLQTCGFAVEFRDSLASMQRVVTDHGFHAVIAPRACDTYPSQVEYFIDAMKLYLNGTSLLTALTDLMRSTNKGLKVFQGVVLIAKRSDSPKIMTVHLGFGSMSKQPWSLELPTCGGCRRPAAAKSRAKDSKERKRVAFHCRKCSLQTELLERPPGILEQVDGDQSGDFYWTTWPRPVWGQPTWNPRATNEIKGSAAEQQSRPRSGSGVSLVEMQVHKKSRT